MAGSQSKSLGEAFAERYENARRRSRLAPAVGARQLPVLHGLNPNGTAKWPIENILAKASEVLADSQRVFRYGNNVVYEVGTEIAKKRLLTLATDYVVERIAASVMANVMTCESGGGDDGPPVFFAAPSRFVAHLLSREPTRNAMREIKIYASRPIFDDDFLLRGPGYHEELGILVHGFDVEPVLPVGTDTNGAVLDRLPTHLSTVLGDFCFRADADVANAVAVLLTGLLVALFIESTKPVVLLDGNQSSVGKTLFARMVGVVLDGDNPDIAHYTAEEEELSKRICANLRGRSQSIVLIDNAKVKAGSSISSPVIEANSMAPRITLRILGQSANYSRPNDLLWFLTMNNTQASPDLVSRGLPIRFRYEGDPGTRDFCGRDPITYAREHRQEILGELAGMVYRWTQVGRPPGQRRHRCSRWAEVVGGILEACGFPEFLDNVDEAASEFNTELVDLAALAEAVLRSRGPRTFINAPCGGEGDEGEGNVETG